jgi:assimilatory nitrate reductase catalytic subunit
VSVTQIDTVLQTITGSAEAQLAQLQDQLKCGTNCGSCVPELKRLVQQRQKVA